MDPIEVVTLEDGGQRAEDIAARLVGWLEATRDLNMDHLNEHKKEALRALEAA